MRSSTERRAGPYRATITLVFSLAALMVAPRGERSAPSRGVRLTASVARVLGGCGAASAAGGVARPRAPKVPGLDDKVLFIGSAASVREAVALLGDKLHIPVVVTEPARPSPDEEKRLGPPGARRKPFRYENVPLRAVLDGVAEAMGCKWRATRGVYVFWVQPERLGGTMRKLARSARRRVPAPTPEELQGVLEEVQTRADGGGTVAAGDLSPRSREVLERALATHLLADAERTAARLESASRALAGLNALDFPRFADEGRVVLKRRGDRNLHLEVQYPDPARPGVMRVAGWAVSPWRRRGP